MKLSDYCEMPEIMDKSKVILGAEEVDAMLKKLEEEYLTLAEKSPEAQKPFNAEDMEKLIESVKRLDWDR